MTVSLPSPLSFLRPACAAAAACLALAACAAPPLQTTRPVVLLGEVHDNAAAHALRLAAFEALLARGERPALVMEQFDRERQGALDAARAAGGDADALIAAAGGPGWNWDFYRPFVAAALRAGVPVVAANVSRADARVVMREGLAAQGFDAAVPPPVLAALAGEIEASHCGQLDAATATKMALAQVARDQSMARALEANAARGAVLLAGNGHVRTDVGAPIWLSAPTRARAEAIGVVEQGERVNAFDRRVEVPRQPRPDVCEGLRAAPAASAVR
ncbi:hypothetical protein CLD22_12610 [Rubrivivax gelatinosus]|nr:hypothetical protein [Rubrivivax gelatinosus]